MNFRLLAFALGEIAVIIGALMSIPLFMAIGYKEDTTILGFGIAIGVCLILGVIGIVVRPPKDNRNMIQNSLKKTSKKPKLSRKISKKSM